MLTEQPRSTWSKDLLFLTLGLAGLFFILLGTRPLFVPDEGRYAEISREMFVSRNYITPYLNGILYFEKPALFYWLGVLAFKLGGVNLWAIRSVNALLGIVGCLLTYITTRTLYDRKTGLLAAMILATNVLYFMMAHMVSLDLPITVFLSATLYAFILGIQHPLGQIRRLHFYAAALFAALAVLTKGLIGIVFPAVIIGLWILTTLQWRQLKTLYLISSSLIFLAVVLPWHLFIQAKHPEFFYIYFVEQHLLRYTDASIGHYEPVWFFIPYLLAGLIPWVVFLPQALWNQRRPTKTSLFFLIWAGFIFLFFSFSKSKLIPYILPAFPPIAILIALALQRFNHKVLVSIGVFSAMFLIGCIAFFPMIDTRTILPLAQTLKPLLQPEDDVVTYNQYFQDLPFYLERRVSILNWRNELSHGMRFQDTHEWMIDKVTFWERWHSQKRVYVLISNSEYEKLLKKRPSEKLYLIKQTSNTSLVSNHPAI